MHHSSDNLFFGRLSNGDVRILKFPNNPAEWPRVNGVYPNALFDVTINDGHWGSIVANASAKGEVDGRWYKAMDFHHGREFRNSFNLPSNENMTSIELRAQAKAHEDAAKKFHAMAAELDNKEKRVKS
jgi:hypothetical protein